jgi:hypothetical protein
MSNRQPTQIGGSQRGTRDLDAAKQNLDLPPEEATIDEQESPGLSAGETTEEAERLAKEARTRRAENTSRPARGPVPVRNAEDDEEADAARSEQPGGDRPSESERPDSSRSRWGRGPA